MPSFASPALRQLVGLSLAVFTTSTALAQQADSLPARPPGATMLKLGLDVSRSWGGYSGFVVPLYFGAERQLGNYWSLTADANVSGGFGYRYGSSVQLKRFAASAGGRYYYGQARRARLGKTTAALSGFYLQLQYNAEFNSYYNNYRSEPRLSYQFAPSAELLWGYQRRLGRHGFVDAGAGLRVQHWGTPRLFGGSSSRLQLEPTLRARVGLAF